MVKLYSWLRLTAIIVVIGANLIVRIESAAGQGQAFSGSLKSGPGISEPNQATHVVSAAAGDTLNLVLDYTGSNSCGGYWLLLTVNNHVLGPWSGGYGDFSGSIPYIYIVPAAMNINIKVEIDCVHTSSSLDWAELSYILTVRIGDSSTLISLDPIAAEVASGLQRIAVDTALPVIIYTPTPVAAQNGNSFINIWQLGENGGGYPALTISADDLLALPNFPVENTLIASTADGFISVYKLTTGEFQINVGPLPDGKIHVIIFDGIPPTHIYGYTWEVSAATP